jgi:nicotinate phosphoribosyltransferase
LLIEARRMLDEAGFPDARIIASNDLDERLITEINEQGARIDAWGVGTKLVTCFDQPALGGVYKLGAYRDKTGAWRDAIKLSEQPAKISNPGNLQVRRLHRGDEMIADIIYDSEHGVTGPELFDIEDRMRPAIRPTFDDARDLLVTFLDHGEATSAPLDLESARARAATELAALSPRSKRFSNPQPYAVGLDRHVHERKQRMIAEARHA